MINYNRHMRPHKDTAAALQRVGIVVRGPPSTGKSETCRGLTRLAAELGISAQPVVLDRYEPEPVNDDAERRYPTLRSLEARWVLLELGYGGFATKNPVTWADIVRGQGYALQLFRLTSPKEMVATRSKGRTDGITADISLAMWERYASEEQFRAFPQKLGLAEESIDTSGLTGIETARRILRSLGL